MTRETEDDWFDDADAPGSATGHGEDDWLHDDAPSAAPRRPALADLQRRRLVAGGVLLVVVLLLALWAGGVFSGGGSNEAAPPTTTTQPPTTTSGPIAPAPLPAPTTTLAPGDSGVQVKRLQRALTRLGYAAGKADGSYGPATVAALKRFQQASNLTADGVFGPKTRQALIARLAAG